MEFHSKAEEIFHGTGIKVVSSHRLLGGVIGDLDGKNNFIDSQVKKWKEELLLLSNNCLHTATSSLHSFH